MREPRLRRTMLITPANRAERLAKAVTLPADSVVFDLEDGVPPAQKAAARRIVAEALSGLHYGGRERVVRINAVGSPAFDDDLAALPLASLDAIMVPKVESADAVLRLAARLDMAEASLGRERPIDLVLTIETPRGVFTALDIADASPRASALFFGSGDYSAATGGAINAHALHVPRTQVVMAAAAAGLQAIDAAFFAALKDAEATRVDAAIARELGFAGKLVFHPNQIEVVNTVFSPTREEIERASLIIRAYEDAIARGHGTVVVDGNFVAIDLVLPARRMLSAARKVELTQ
jgi:citrate lyase subunit beta/citryl-CoA lyase